MKHIRATGKQLAAAGIAFGMLLGMNGHADAQLNLQSIGSALLGGGQQQAAPSQGGIAQLMQAYLGAKPAGAGRPVVARVGDGAHRCGPARRNRPPACWAAAMR